MKILLINDSYNEGGGVEKLFANTKELLESKGHKIHIIKGEEERKNYNYFKTLTEGWFSLKYYRLVKKEIKNFKPDIVHIHGLIRALSPSILLAIMAEKIPVVFSVHDAGIICPKNEFIYKDGTTCKYGIGWKCLISDCFPKSTNFVNFLFKRFYCWIKFIKLKYQHWFIKRYVDLFIAPPSYVKYWLQKTLNLSPTKVVHLPNFTFIDKGNNQVKRKANSFLFVGRLTTEKGVHIAIRAMDVIVNKNNLNNVYLKIAGTGPQEENLKKLTTELKLNRNVQFVGNISNPDLNKYYQESTATLITSLCVENCPLVILEAMACETPVIASNIEGITDLLIDGETGYLFGCGNYLDLAEKVLKILENPMLAKKIGRYAQEIYNKEYNPNKHYNNLMRIYKDVLSS